MERAPSRARELLCLCWKAHPLTGSSLGTQYSSVRMIVSTRVVTAGSAGSGEPNSVARS